MNMITPRGERMLVFVVWVALRAFLVCGFWFVVWSLGFSAISLRSSFSAVKKTKIFFVVCGLSKPPKLLNA
jgi:hypothetical protein